MMKILKTAGIGILFIVLLASVQEAFNSLHYRSYEKELSAGQKLHEDGDFAEAEKALKALSRKYPEEPAAFIELSYLYEEMGSLDFALTAAQTALSKTSKAMTRGSLFLNRLRLLTWKENLEQRIRRLPLAIEGQDAIRIWSLGDQEGALEKLQELEKKYPGSYEPHAAMSVLYKNKGDNKSAVKEAETGLDKIARELKSKKLSRRMKNLIEEDRTSLRDLINEINLLYAGDLK